MMLARMRASTPLQTVHARSLADVPCPRNKCRSAVRFPMWSKTVTVECHRSGRASIASSDAHAPADDAQQWQQWQQRQQWQQLQRVLVARGCGPARRRGSRRETWRSVPNPRVNIGPGRQRVRGHSDACPSWELASQLAMLGRLGRLRCALFRCAASILAVSAPLPQHPTSGHAEPPLSFGALLTLWHLVLHASKRLSLGVGRRGRRPFHGGAVSAAAVQEHEACAPLTSGPDSSTTSGAMAHGELAGMVRQWAVQCAWRHGTALSCTCLLGSSHGPASRRGWRRTSSSSASSSKSPSAA